MNDIAYRKEVGEMLKYIVCEDKEDDLNRAVQTITKVMMNYDIEYKVCKFKEYNEDFHKVIIEPHDTKVYLLDIELTGHDGLEIASEIREQEDNSYIVFVTSHPEWQNDIFHSRLEAIDYISKRTNYQDRLEETLRYILNRKVRNKTFEFSYNHTTYRVLYKDITYIEKDPLVSRCIIHFVNDKPKYVKKSLTSFESELKPLFFRTHKACLVNLDNISKVEYAESIIHFKNGESTPLLSSNNKKELKSRVGSFESIF